MQATSRSGVEGRAKRMRERIPQLTAFMIEPGHPARMAGMRREGELLEQTLHAIDILPIGYISL